jgi:hypothetical protein
VPRYERLYERGAYAPAAEKRRIGKLLRPVGNSKDPRFRRSRERARQARARESRPEPEQASLF